MGGPGTHKTEDGGKVDVPATDNFGCGFPVTWLGLPFSCAEAAYQASKFLRPRKLAPPAAADAAASLTVDAAGAPVYDEDPSFANFMVLDALRTSMKDWIEASGAAGAARPAELRDEAFGNWLWSQGQTKLGVRADWQAVKVFYMFAVNVCKLQQNPAMGAALDGTGRERIWFERTFEEWGEPRGSPRERCENWNGRIMMALRELRRPAAEQDRTLLAAFFTLMADKCEAALKGIKPDVAAIEAEPLLAHLKARVEMYGGRAVHPLM